MHILHPYSSHIVQPFDCVLEYSLKNNIFKLFQLKHRRYPSILSLNDIAKIRKLLLLVVIDAWISVAAPSTCQKAFKSPGLFPLSFCEIENYPYLRKTSCNDILEKSNRRFSPGSILTEDNAYLQLYNHCYKTNFQNANDIPLLKIDKVKYLL